MVRKLLLLLGALAAGCNAPSGTATDGSAPDLLGPLMQKSDVDILFVIEDIADTPIQQELQVRFPELVKILTDTGKTSPASYHIGVITPDLGIGQATIGGGQCHPGGDGAKLQAVGKAAQPNCQPPTGGASFIEIDQIAGTDNLPAGQDLATSFTCMASVGSAGCGFQQSLEASYRALHDPIPENAGFLRDDALLVVFFLHDKDECSAPDDTDLGDDTPEANAKYGQLAQSQFRCYEAGVGCGDPIMPISQSSMGTLSMCRPLTAAEGSGLIDVQKYIDYFNQPSSSGGVKADPRDVIVAAIMPPPAPVTVVFADPSQSTPGPYQPCPGPSATCLPLLQASCMAPSNPGFFGDPTVRLSAVVNAVGTMQTTSMCDTDYSAALQGVGELIAQRVMPPASP